jgi:hypothetical protein
MVEVQPKMAGLWFEVANKPYLVRVWTNANDVSQRLRKLAMIGIHVHVSRELSQRILFSYEICNECLSQSLKNSYNVLDMT